MFGTYKKDDVIILLKDISGMVEPQSTEEREKQIQSGRHYCEMLPIEYAPSQAYMETFENAIRLYSEITAQSVASLSEKIWAEKGKDAVLVSLARAGTPIGILLKHFIQKKYKCNVPHYTISIIRGRGIDKNAMDFILSRHQAQNIQFVDGWTGKGAIQNELNKAMCDFPNVSPGLAVLSDPAFIAEKSGTHSDFLIASSCLNSTVSGLLSRTFLRSDIIGPNDFHGAVFYKDLIPQDVTYHFIDSVEEKFSLADSDKFTQGETELDLCSSENSIPEISALDEVKKIAEEFNVKDINLVKPGIGEATRVLLRRLPWKILVHSLNDFKHLGHLYQLAEEKSVEVAEYPLKHYRACGIIKTMADA